MQIIQTTKQQDGHPCRHRRLAGGGPGPVLLPARLQYFRQGAKRFLKLLSTAECARRCLQRRARSYTVQCKHDRTVGTSSARVSKKDNLPSDIPLDSANSRPIFRKSALAQPPAHGSSNLLVLIKVSNHACSPLPVFPLDAGIVVALVRSRLHAPNAHMPVAPARRNEVVRAPARGCPCDGGDGICGRRMRVWVHHGGGGCCCGALGGRRRRRVKSEQRGGTSGRRELDDLCRQNQCGVSGLNINNRGRMKVVL